MQLRCACEIATKQEISCNNKYIFTTNVNARGLVEQYIHVAN